MRVALVHDYLIQYGGAERVLEEFCSIFPNAPIYTLVYDAELTGHAFEGREIKTSFLQHFPFFWAGRDKIFFFSKIFSHIFFFSLIPKWFFGEGGWDACFLLS